jgi:hypothetical protein
MINHIDTISEWTLDEGVRAFIYCTAVFSPPYQSSARCAGCSRKNICAGPFHGFHDLFRRSGFCAWFSTTVCTARLRFISADIEASRLCTLSHFFSTVSGPRGRAAFGTTANRRRTCRFPEPDYRGPCRHRRSCYGRQCIGWINLHGTTGSLSLGVITPSRGGCAMRIRQSFVEKLSMNAVQSLVFSHHSAS